jgi:M6 family metalloprotease-like protein
MEENQKKTMKIAVIICSIIIFSSFSYILIRVILPELEGPQNDGIFYSLKNEKDQNENTTIKALCVIVDFNDSTFEDFETYSEPGLKNLYDVNNTLNNMSDHWSWMSLNTEIMQWDIVRIQLSQKLTKDAFIGWWEFREEIVKLADEKIESDDYDSDKDGYIDVLWGITSNNLKDYDAGYEYIIGGMSRNGNANVFIDSQNSLALADNAYGCFNHEIGHCFGLPDLYGEFDSLFYLTLMSDTWARPAVTFSAYEKISLGWLEPLEPQKWNNHIFLRPAELYFDAVLVPTSQNAEYFLIEYRKKPSNGFGSGAYVDYDGLVIYNVDQIHIVEGGHGNRGYPPFIYVEPADGSIDYWMLPPLSNFWYPENSESTGVFKGRERDSHDLIFTLNNLSITDDGITFDIILE